MLVKDKPIRAYIALGSNLGDRNRNLREAITLLNSVPGVQVIQVAGFLENPAVGGPEGSPAFLNAVVEVDTWLPARELLDQLLRIERQLGRERREKWGPRTIDLDLVLYGSEVIRTPELTVPHPLMHERRFVLEPLAQIAPEVVHPVLKRTARELLHGLRDRT